MVTVVDATWGMWLVCGMVMPFMYGIAILQTFLYFQWYSNDPWGNKLVVIILCVLETVQVALYEHSAYYYLVGGITSPQNRERLIWGDSAQILCIYLVAAIVQGFFAFIIYKLNKRQNKSVLVVLVIGVFGLTSISAGIAQTIKVARLSLWTELQSTKIVTSIQSGFALGCDALITISLCITLHTGRREIQSTERTKTMVNKLIVFAVNRGILTTAFQTLNLILFLAIPNTFWFFLGIDLASELYINSLLASLNAREYIKSSANKRTPASNSIPMTGGSQPPKFSRGPDIQHTAQTFSTAFSDIHFEDDVELKSNPHSLTV